MPLSLALDVFSSASAYSAQCSMKFLAGYKAVGRNSGLAPADCRRQRFSATSLEESAHASEAATWWGAETADTRFRGMCIGHTAAGDGHE